MLPPLPGTESAGRLQLLARLDGAQVMGELRCAGGEAGEAWRAIIALHEELRAHAQGTRATAPGAAGLDGLGRKLFALLFTGPVRKLYEKARRARSVELVFSSLVPWIADKPWELMRDPRRGFVARGKVRFSRSTPGDVPAVPPAPRRGAMRVLLACPQPRGEARLSWEKELRAIEEGFAPLEERGLMRLTLLRPASLSTLRAALRSSRYDVIHFAGHGGWDSARDGGYLLLDGTAGNLGEGQRVAPAALVRLLRGRGLRLLVLNACESGRGSRRGSATEFNRGVAPALLAAGLPAVLANQYPVFDRPAAAFAQALYTALGHGDSIVDAVRSARLSLARESGAGDPSWAVPVLYARDPKQRLCARARSARKRASPVDPRAAPR